MQRDLEKLSNVMDWSCPVTVLYAASPRDWAADAPTVLRAAPKVEIVPNCQEFFIFSVNK